MAAVQSLGFLGAGRIANALVRGFLAASESPKSRENNDLCIRPPDVLPQKNIYASARSKGSLDEIGVCFKANDHQYLPCKDFFQKFGINVTHDNGEVVRNCKVVWITLKPHGVCSVLREVAPYVTKDHVFVSAAAGISLSNMEKVSTAK